MHSLTVATAEEYLEHLKPFEIDPWAKSPFKSLSECKISLAVPDDRRGALAFCSAVHRLVAGEITLFSTSNPFHGFPSRGPVDDLCKGLLAGFDIEWSAGKRIMLMFDADEVAQLNAMICLSVLACWDTFVCTRVKRCFFRWTHDDYCEAFALSPVMLETMGQCFDEFEIERIRLSWDP